mmetsp:Transcript_3658/g.6938  ORF Transcript_3658/g.6938 Transcript_3658/m.6938 type:complete len:220 (-) Transcript_3658:522-1181(-)
MQTRELPLQAAQQDPLIRPAPHHVLRVVIRGQYILDDGRQNPERPLGLHVEQQEGRQKVHGLAVPHGLIPDAVRDEQRPQRRQPLLRLEVRVVGKRPVQVLLHLHRHWDVCEPVLVLPLLLDEVENTSVRHFAVGLRVAGLGRSAGAEPPDLLAHLEGDAGADSLRELQGEGGQRGGEVQLRLEVAEGQGVVGFGGLGGAPAGGHGVEVGLGEGGELGE